MKIGIFTESYLPQSNGVSTSVDICAQALEDRGHEVYIIAPKHPGYKDKKANVYRLSSIKVLSNPEIRIALQLPEKALLDVLKIDYDVIHCHAGMGGITAVSLEIARARNIPLIATNHTLWNRYTHYFFNGKLVTPKMTERIIKFIGNLCDYTIAPTEYVKKEMIAYGITKPIGVMPSGIDCLKYKNVAKGFIRKKINVSKKTKILLSVGRLGKEKSFNFLIEAFKVIHDNNRDTVLVLAGDGPEKANLKRLVSRFGLTEYVHFLGIIPHENIPQVYVDADLFLFASQTETQGMVILEAFASGVPAVVVEDEVFVNVVKNEKNGYLVKKDPEFFAQKVLHLLKDKKTYTAFVEGALQTAEEFSVTNTAEELEQLYERLIREKNSSRKKRTITDINIQQVKKFIRKTTQQFINTYRL